MENDADNNLVEQKAQLLGSLLLFTQVFYKIRTGRDFTLSRPVSRESHYISIAKELTKIMRGDITNLAINIPPRYGKSEMMIHFVAWAMAAFPDSNFLYVSYNKELAGKATQTIREIISLPHYRKLFGVEIKADVDSKFNFETTAGGAVWAAGTQGTITGRGAGVKGVQNRFSGCMIIDDPLKPDEATSDTIRSGVNDWYYNTAGSRFNNGDATPRIGVGQKTHEDDLFTLWKKEGWQQLVIKALDDNNHALDPSLHSVESLLKIKEQSPYVFAAQYQQDPQPAGGGIFKPEWIYLMDEDPAIELTFITADTAETDKTYNDATVFSFWGLYRINDFNAPTQQWALHWLNCEQIWVEPNHLRSEFMQFYTNCCRYKVPPQLAAVEKKSTGVTLVSALHEIRGMEIIDIQRNTVEDVRYSRVSKTDRFLNTVPYLAAKQVSIPRYGKHTHMCIEHLKKITANDSHRYDDIADTLADAVKIGLIDRVLQNRLGGQRHQAEKISAEINSHFKNIQALRQRSHSSW